MRNYTIAMLFVMLTGISMPVYAGFWTGVAIGAAASGGSEKEKQGVAVSYDPSNVVKCEGYKPRTNRCTMDSGHVPEKLPQLGCNRLGLRDVKNIIEIYPPGRADYYLIEYDPEGRKC